MSSLLRSTKFVKYFTSAARIFILNSPRTTEANSFINTKALCGVNNAIFRDYATTKKAETLEPLLQKLDSEVRKYGRIAKRNIEEVLFEINQSEITSSQSLLVIRCCGELVPEELPEQRTLLVQKIWNVLAERNVPMDISHYNALLRVYLENEHPFSPAKFLEELETKGVQANRVTYQRLMWRYCQSGDIEGATKVLEKMRELDMPVSEPVLNALVMGHAFNGDTDGAKAVLETMATAGLAPSNRTYTLLACGFAKKGDIEGVKNVIKTATDKNIYLADKDILDIIEHFAYGGHGDKVEQMFEYLQKGVGYNQDVCNVTLKLLNKGQEDTAMKLLKTMANNVEDTFYKGAFFVKHLLKINKSAEEIVNTCRKLQEEGLIPNALLIATEEAVQQAELETAEKLFAEAKKDGLEIREHYYWPLLVRKGKEQDIEGLLRIISIMCAQGLMPSGEGLRDYVLPYLMKKYEPQNTITELQIAGIPAIHSARMVMVHLLNKGMIKEAANIALLYRPWGYYNIIARPLVKALIKTSDVNSFVSILHVISCQNAQASQSEENSSAPTDTVRSMEVGRILLSAVKAFSGSEICEQLLKAVHCRGLQINTNSAEEIAQFLGQNKNMTANIYELLSQLTSPDLQMTPIESPQRENVSKSSAQWEKVLENVQNKGTPANNTKRLQRMLLSSYINEKNVEKVKNYIKELESSDFELTSSTLAQLFEFFCEHDEIDLANECKSKLSVKDPSFKLNKFKFVQMAFALVRADRFDEAIQFLKENKFDSGETADGGFILRAKCWQLLNYLAEQKAVAKVKKMTTALIENNLIEPSNVLLGPLIKAHLMNDDLDGALNEFENCCKQYRSTPWKGELMKYLILKEDATKLQWLADISTQIHGESNILHDLVFAFVECGRLRQARRILETPGLQTRHKRFHDTCEKYVEEGKSEYLEGLLEATKELSHIDRSKMFSQLLVTYCKADETEKALGLWTLLQEEGEIPSDQFLRHLANHLESKNQKVPFVVPKETPQESNIEKTEVVEKIVKKNLTNTPSKTEPPRNSKKFVSKKIESLINDGKITEAIDYTVNNLESGVKPVSSVVKYLLKKLAQNGEVEKIQLIGKYLDDNAKKNVTYDDKLTMAIFASGAGESHIDNLLKSVQAAKSDEDLQQAIKSFPRSDTLASIMNNGELLTKCRKVAEIAGSKGFYLPANLLWMEYLLADNIEDADSFFKNCLVNAKFLLFRRLLQEGYTRNAPQYIEKLLDVIEPNPDTRHSALGTVYSRLIDLYLGQNNIEMAKSTYQRATKKGVADEHINEGCLSRLRSVIEE